MRRKIVSQDTSPKPSALVWAFVQGAKWWEYESSGATMWSSDQHEACREAQKRLRNGILGKKAIWE